MAAIVRASTCHFKCAHVHSMHSVAALSGLARRAFSYRVCLRRCLCFLTWLGGYSSTGLNRHAVRNVPQASFQIIRDLQQKVERMVLHGHAAAAETTESAVTSAETPGDRQSKSNEMEKRDKDEDSWAYRLSRASLGVATSSVYGRIRPTLEPLHAGKAMVPLAIGTTPACCWSSS